MSYYGVYASQCDIANKYIGVEYCCSSPYSCNETGFLALGLYDFDYFSNWWFNLDWSVVKGEIDHNRPFIFGWWFPQWIVNGYGHFMVARGYKIENNINSIYVNNSLGKNNPAGPSFSPFFPPSPYWITYKDYGSGYIKGLGSYTHYMDYYGIRYMGTTYQRHLPPRYGQSQMPIPKSSPTPTPTPTPTPIYN